MRILIVGSGGREHALAWKLRQSSRVERVFIAPGNAGTREEGENVDLPQTDFAKLIRFARETANGQSTLRWNERVAERSTGTEK